MPADIYRIGIDVGSTTTKLAVLQDGKPVVFHYVRHYARQRESILKLLLLTAEKLGEEAQVSVCLTGSGARTLSEALGLLFTQEVVASAVALKHAYARVGTAIELGGQDAKIIFFREDEKGESSVFDMRMNGSCAGGTGAFIDEVATVLDVPVEELNALAEEGSKVYDVSGRCAVFAKTDIQALLNQGVRKSDIALSCYYAIAKQTIGGLAQGLEIRPPVAFAGGPLTFHPRLRRVFAERLGLEDGDILVPERPELLMACGAALSIEELHGEAPPLSLAALRGRLEALRDDTGTQEKGQLFFENKAEEEAFAKRHRKKELTAYRPKRGERVAAYLGIDAGSTTTKLVLLNEDDEILDSFYASNEGSPLKVAKRALLSFYEKYERAGAVLDIRAAASTGYGEFLLSKAFRTETHVVETVAHAAAASKYVEDPSFILDIGGQDMKAIWLEKGVITNIVVNEACSAGCGSFLENFAGTLHIDAGEIAGRAFLSDTPAKLGSRCTVFMNSSIITEQRNGRTPNDIMAGLCRSVIENVFTKVIRIPNIDSLGDKIVLQGGTFRNDAVLRAMEQYVGREVIRAPYPGLMGAIGAALAAKEQVAKGDFQKTFLSPAELRDFSYRREADAPCPYCTNHCRRTILTFSTGESWVTNNRCERGEVVGDPQKGETAEKLKALAERKKKTPNLFEVRQRLQNETYPYEKLLENAHTVIGIPRVLYFWEGLPFWRTLFSALGFTVKLSPPSTREIYENGIYAVPSDTECFPAKLVHGHIRALLAQGVHRIFLPEIVVTPPENTEKNSFSRCALVKGYPIVIGNSDNPERFADVKLDTPYFYWYSEKDRDGQILSYMRQTYGIEERICRKAIAFADSAQKTYDRKLKEAGAEVLRRLEGTRDFAVVLAGRPYHNDPLVHHELPELFVRLGVPVLTADSLPEISSVELKNSRMDVMNNFHARILGGSILAAGHPNLEFTQIVSFGCGHDAVLSDEVVRICRELHASAPLILKVDESDAQGPLRIRVRSFVETIRKKREKEALAGSVPEKAQTSLSDPYPVKFTKKERREKQVLIPNSSHAFSRMLSAAFRAQGVRAVVLDVGREEAIALGKRYTHNDICFPAQIVIGEVLAALKSGKYDPDGVAVGMAKYLGCCRLPHYATILRKALDDAGYAHISIMTNDDVDYHRMHPGFKIGIFTMLRIAVGLPMIDALEEILRKIRPYERIKGSADKAFDEAVECLTDGIEKNGVIGAVKGFRKALSLLSAVDYDDSVKRPAVLIVGEYLLNFHPGANREIERYLEDNGFEIIEAKMSDVIQKSYFCQDSQLREFKVHRDFTVRFWSRIANVFFAVAHRLTDYLARREKLHEPSVLLGELSKESDALIHHTFDTGEGILIPAEILHHAKRGCKNFVILQPFGCLPNHVVGRGIAKRIKELFPDVELLALDFDPDVSFANLENRLQMLVSNRRG